MSDTAVWSLVSTSPAVAWPGRDVAMSRTSRYVEHIMGMPISLAMRGRHARDARGQLAWAGVQAVLRDVDRVFSTYRADSAVSRLGRGQVEVSECPPEVAEVLELGRQAQAQSGGAFRVYRPTSSGHMALDPSGVVKGWAVERAAAALRSLPDTDFCLSAGGDMVCLTTDPGRLPWRIGIEDPWDTSRLVAVVPIHSGAVATSGSSHRGNHLVDGRTGRIPTGIASVTVVGPSLVWADIDATAAFAQGRDAARWLETRIGRTALVTWSDRSTTLVRGRGR